MKEKYDDIINLPHHVSKKHKQMSLENRSAQFAPFAALTGFGDEIIETGRSTDERIEINDELKEILDNKLQNIQRKIHERPKATIRYFIQDKNKSGGKYVDVTGNVIKIDEYRQEIILEDKNKIPIGDIVDIFNIQLKQY